MERISKGHRGWPKTVRVTPGWVVFLLQRWVDLMMECGTVSPNRASVSPRATAWAPACARSLQELCRDGISIKQGDVWRSCQSSPLTEQLLLSRSCFGTSGALAQPQPAETGIAVSPPESQSVALCPHDVTVGSRKCFHPCPPCQCFAGADSQIKPRKVLFPRWWISHCLCSGFFSNYSYWQDLPRIECWWRNLERMTEFLMPFSQSCIQEPLASGTLLPTVKFCLVPHREMVFQHPEYPHQPKAGPAGNRGAAAGRNSEQDPKLGVWCPLQRDFFLHCLSWKRDGPKLTRGSSSRGRRRAEYLQLLLPMETHIVQKLVLRKWLASSVIISRCSLQESWINTAPAAVIAAAVSGFQMKLCFWKQKEKWKREGKRVQRVSWSNRCRECLGWLRVQLLEGSCCPDLRI